MTTKTRTGYPVIDEILENIAPSHEQPAGTPVSEWSYNYDGDRYHIRAAGSDDCAAHADKLKDAEQIVEDHNWRLRGESPTDTGVEGANQWSVEGGSLVGRRRIRDTEKYWVADVSSDELASQIVSDHNQHQHCATQLQYLGNRAEELSSLLAEMTTERDGLREALRQLRAMFFERSESGGYMEKGKLVKLDNEQHPWIPGAEAPRAIAIIDTALNHVGQGEGER